MLHDWQFTLPSTSNRCTCNEFRDNLREWELHVSSTLILLRGQPPRPPGARSILGQPSPPSCFHAQHNKQGASPADIMSKKFAGGKPPSAIAAGLGNRSMPLSQLQLALVKPKDSKKDRSARSAQVVGPLSCGPDPRQPVQLLTIQRTVGSNGTCHWRG